MNLFQLNWIRWTLSYPRTGGGLHAGTENNAGIRLWSRFSELGVLHGVVFDRLARGLVRLTIAITQVEADKSAG